MKCADARQMIHASLDSRLAGNEAEHLADHVRDCRGCKAYGAVFGTLRKRVAALGGVKDNTGAVAAMVERAVNAPVDSHRFTKRILLLPPAKFRFPYALLVLVVVGLAVYAGMAALAPSDSMAATLVQEHRMRAGGRAGLDTAGGTAADLEKWFEEKAGRAVHVPEFGYAGAKLDGGKACGESGNRYLCAAYSINGRPLSLYVFSGSAVELPKGRKCEAGGRSANVSACKNATVMSWASGGQSYVIVTCLDEETLKALLASTN
jgi:anti-sigma factor RsiW